MRKHPQVDHDGQLDQLRHGVGAADRVRRSGCLNACDRSNVLVVQPTPAARRAGARPVWFAEMLDRVVLAAVAGWVRAGGPGAAPLPPGLRRHVMPAPRWGPSRGRSGADR